MIVPLLWAELIKKKAHSKEQIEQLLHEVLNAILQYREW